MTVSVDKKTLKIIFSICVLAVAICIADCVSEIRATADYSKADGTLVSIDRSIDLGLQNNSKTDIIRYKVYQYQVNQQEYTCQYRTYVLFQPKIGSHKTIYYSSLNISVFNSFFNCFLCFFWNYDAGIYEKGGRK